MSSQPDKVFLAPTGIPELGVPPDSVVLLWIGIKYSYLVQRGYDHGVIWNHFEIGNLADVTPGPGLAEPLGIAVNSPTGVSAAPAPGPSPRPDDSRVTPVLLFPRR